MRDLVTVSDKSLSDLEFLAIQAPKSQTIHAIKAMEHLGWEHGSPGTTVCGRGLDEMYLLGSLSSEDKPCKLCERTLPVISIMFETVEAVTKLVKRAEIENEQMAYMSWMSHGIHFGYISPPFCGLHNEAVPLTEDEKEDMDAGEQICAYVVRLYGSSVDYDEA